MFEDVEFWHDNEQLFPVKEVGPHRKDCWVSDRGWYFNVVTGEVPGINWTVEIRQKIKPIALSHIGLDN
jgi:hypothetical protein